MAVTPLEGRPVSNSPLRKLEIDINPDSFSPLGKKKSVTITFPDDQSPDINRWSLALEDSAKKPIRSFCGTGPLPPFLGWEGLMDDAQPAPEGVYQVHLQTFGINNELLSDDQEQVSIIALRSHFGIQLDNPYLSFREGVRRPQISFKINAGGPREVTSWDFEVSEAFTNKVVYETQGRNELPETLRWNGKDSGKKPVPDGTYLCFLSAEDKAGNPLKTDAARVFVQTAPPLVQLTAPSHWLDATQPVSLSLGLNAADAVGIQSWSLTLSDPQKDQPLKTLEGVGDPPVTLVWDGMDATGKTVPPGAFLSLALQAVDKAGNTGESAPFSLQMDFKGTAKGGSLSMNLTSVSFDAQGVDLSDADKKEIETATTSITSYLNKSLLVVRGYCASSETGDLVELSHDRAKKVADWITQKLQLPEGAVLAVGMGDQSPRSDTLNAKISDEKRRIAILTVITSSP
jgi:outer membrane protein OmpA-like peptidoglycan-associated protein